MIQKTWNILDRGTLNAGKTAITTLAFAQDFSLDQLGNWATSKIDNDGNGNYNSTGDLNHSRAHNPANETGTVTTTYGSNWIDPKHDKAGNMTEMPIPGTESSKHKAVYDAWNRLVQIKNNSDAVIAKNSSSRHQTVYGEITQLRVQYDRSRRPFVGS